MSNPRSVGLKVSNFFSAFMMLGSVPSRGCVQAQVGRVDGRGGHLQRLQANVNLAHRTTLSNIAIRSREIDLAGAGGLWQNDLDLVGLVAVIVDRPVP